MGWYVNLEDYRYYCYCLTNSVFVKTLLMDSWQPITIMNKYSEDESQGITTKLTNLQLNLYFHLKFWLNVKNVNSHSFIMPMSMQRFRRQAWQWRRLSLVMVQLPLKGQVKEALRFILRL